MISLLISVFLFSTSSYGQTDTTLFKISGESLKFYNYPELRITVSKPCDEASKNNLCKDLEFLKIITLSQAGLKGTGGINPASVICKKLLKGNVVIGFDPNNNENSFCRLKDNFYIDSGTLTYYALKNEGITQQPRSQKPLKK